MFEDLKAFFLERDVFRRAVSAFAAAFGVAVAAGDVSVIPPEWQWIGYVMATLAGARGTKPAKMPKSALP